MRTVALGQPPDLGEKARYGEYRDWLLHHFYDHLCSYCLIRDDAVQVDHYEPQAYKPERINDPGNLLLACARCNRAKSDYHPSHDDRRRKTKDESGFLILDVRRADYSEMFHLDQEGKVSSRDGPTKERAAWNVATLGWDRVPRAHRRKEVLELCQAAEHALLYGNSIEYETEAARWRTMLDKLLPELARRYLLLEIFGISVSEELCERVRELRASLRTPVR